MNPLFLLVFVAFLDSPHVATADYELCPTPEIGPKYRKVRTCPSKAIRILCKAREDMGQNGELVLADCYMVSIGMKRRTELTGEQLLLKVEKNVTVDDGEGTHLTAHLQFQTECSSTAETVGAIFNFLTHTDGREFDPCDYLDSAFMVCAFSLGLVVVQIGVFYWLKYIVPDDD